MQNCIEAIHGALNGCAYCIADHREFWVKTKQGFSYPIASVRDELDDYFPIWCIFVTDYLGRDFHISDLCKQSQEDLFGLLVDELY